MFRFETTRGLYQDASEPWSHDEGDTSLSKLPHLINDRIFDSRRQIALGLHTQRFSMVSNLEPSDPETEPLTPNHCCHSFLLPRLRSIQREGIVIVKKIRTRDFDESLRFRPP
ncbi:hypothetical protein AVEN_239950-1 [Araneus ventricosus]|uniref:Uncharacterized protein n=1 Tax=Araneus ventricosus TaxID=182803 RepID=A0A4Y1ZPJ2_ARAVE|nr:hypothetical protein AVEN_239950-1 [Araneus ventricosus]